MRKQISVDELSCRPWLAMQKILCKIYRVQICFFRLGPPCFNEFYPSRCSLVQLVLGSSVWDALFWPLCVFCGVVENGCCGGTWCAMGCDCPGLGSRGFCSPVLWQEGQHRCGEFCSQLSAQSQPTCALCKGLFNWALLHKETLTYT